MSLAQAVLARGSDQREQLADGPLCLSPKMAWSRDLGRTITAPSASVSSRARAVRSPRDGPGRRRHQTPLGRDPPGGRGHPGMGRGRGTPAGHSACERWASLSAAARPAGWTGPPSVGAQPPLHLVWQVGKCGSRRCAIADAGETTWREHPGGIVAIHHPLLVNSALLKRPSVTGRDLNL